MANPQPVRITTALPAEDLLFLALEGTEELGRSFTYQIDLQSPKPDLEFETLLGKDACVELDLPSGETRYFHGYITDVTQTGRAAGRGFGYRAYLRPWLWFLTRTADCKIFQAKTVPEIIKDVFRGHGFSDFKDSLGGSYKPWEYCVQYRETAFNFVSRLMESEGIYYYFTHEAGKHTLVLADSYSGHELLTGYAQVPYFPPSKSARRDEHVFDWVTTKSVQPGTFAMVDYNFRKPRVNLAASSAVTREHAHAEYEVRDYPGEYDERAEGDTYARARIEEIHAQYERVHGVCDVRGVCAGGLFSLQEHPREDQNREYLIVASHQHVTLSSYESGDSELEYQCRFEAIDSRTPYRAPRLTPRPVVQGPQTAIVVGKAGSEIWTDEYGRVKVKFHWDRLGKEENSSCWVRVSQASWAGKTWGGMHIPRIGQEVIVEFLEGDPDQPIITGRVYNADNMPPYALPDHATKSTLKSNSSKGGEGFNELRFEDKKGDEQIFVHAEKNMDIRVKNDRFETIGQSRHLVIEKDKRERVKHDRHEIVDNHHNEKIGGDYNFKLAGKEAKAVEKTLSLTVDGEVVEVFKDNHSETVTKDYYLKAENIVIEGTTNVTVKVGDSYIAIESGGIKIGTTGKIVLEATDKIEAKGTAGVKIESPASVEVKGMKIDVKADTKVSVEGGAQAAVKGPMVDVSGDSMVKIQGGIVKIN